MAVPTFIDIEASGFGSGSYPIEIGLVDADGNTHCFLVKPEPEWSHWDLQAAQVHRIERDTLFKHGKVITEVAENLNQILVGKTVYTDAWGFDSSWVARLFHDAGVRQRFRLESLLIILDEDQAASWSATKQQVADTLGLVRHRASSDAKILQETWLRLTA